MYSHSGSPLVANLLAVTAKTEGKQVDVVVLDGGFHKFLNTVSGSDDAAIANVPGLVEGVVARSWKRTKTRGLVDAREVEQMEQLSPPAIGRGIFDHTAKSLLKMHGGKMNCEDLDKLCKCAN